MNEVTTDATEPRILEEYAMYTDNVIVQSVDKPSEGGAPHVYQVMDKPSGPDDPPKPLEEIRFQKGPVKENGVNGTTEEALLMILIDRLEHFQEGDYSCDETELALVYARSSLEQLHERTRDRTQRGVEGTSEA